MSTAKVHPETGPASEPPRVFPRGPVYGTSVSCYPDDYLAAKARVGGDQFLTLKDGRQLCYFKDGAEDGVPMICMHGGGEGKWSWLQKEPLPGVLQVAIDRMAYGKSDSVANTLKYTFADVVDDVTQIADHFKFDQFVLCGFSIGSSWALQCAASGKLDGRLRGLILFGCMSDTGHPRMSKKQVSAVGRPPSFLNPATGCCGCILRKSFAAFGKQAQKYDFKNCLQEEATSAKCKPVWAELKEDPFWVCTKVDSYLANHDPQALLGDANRSLCSAWLYDLERIPKTLPIHIHQGRGDYAMGARPASAEFLKEILPWSELEWVDGCGHVGITGPNERFRGQVARAIAKMPKQ